MKTITQLLPLLFLCLLTSCNGGGAFGWGASGVIEHIEVKTIDESFVNHKLVEWAEANGFTKSKKSWEEFTGDSNARNNNGDVVQPVAYIRAFTGGLGNYALGFAASTESHKYITVFSDVEFEAKDEAVSDAAEVEFNQLEKDFHEFVETELPVLIAKEQP